MALSEWDKKNLTGSQQRAVLSYTEAWERAMRTGDAAAARKAHEGAESIRRLAGYSGGDSGAGFTAAETSAASSTRQTHAQDARRAAEQAAARYAEKQAIDASLVPTRTDADGGGKAGGSGAAQSTWTARFKSGAGTDHSGSGRGFGDTAAGRTTQPGFADPNPASRIKNTIAGGAKRSLASDLNSTANAYDLTRGARERMMNEYLANYEHGLERARHDLQQLEELGASAWDIEQQRMTVNEWQRKVDAMTEAIVAQGGATSAAYDLADDMKSSADADIEDAKKGLNRFERLAADVGAKAMQMGTDAAKSWYLLNRFNVNSGAEDFVKRLPLAGRIYGENTQIARQEGADAKSAAVYGAITAIADTEIEKWFDGLGKFYGKAWADDAAKKFAKRFKNSSVLQYIAKAEFNDLGEGVVESIVTDLANEILKSTYNGKDSIQNGIETEWGRVARNMLINTIIAILSGDSGMESN